MAKTKEANRKEVQHECEVALTKDEVIERADELANLLADHSNKDEDFKEEAKQIRTELKELRDRIEELGEVVRTKKEKREVNCYEIPDYEKEVVEVFRSDTDERVHARQLTPEDRQQQL